MSSTEEAREAYFATDAETLHNCYGEAYEVVPRQRADAYIAALEAENRELRETVATKTQRGDSWRERYHAAMVLGREEALAAQTKRAEAAEAERNRYLGALWEAGIERARELGGLLHSDDPATYEEEWLARYDLAHKAGRDGEAGP